MSVLELVSNFNDSCWIPMAKALTPFLKTLDKKIPNFQLYFNAKKYNSTNKVDFTDKERYDSLVNSIVKLVEESGLFVDFTVCHNDWIKELNNCMCMEQVYNVLSVNFLKGSYAKMIDDFNRVMIPKKASDDDENDEPDPTENLKKCVKNYSQNFLKLVESNYKSGYKLYLNYLTTKDEHTETLCSQMLSIKSNVFSIYAVKSSSQILGLWVSECELNDSTFELIDYNTYALILTNQKYTFNLNPEHLTNLDTIKRNWVNKQFELFVKHTEQINKTDNLYFYKAYYLYATDYDSYSELQFTNAVNSFPVSFEDYTRNAFALFYFSRNPLKVECYWITTKPIEQTLSEYDKSLFDWKTSTVDEFVDSKNVSEDVLISILH